MCNMLHKKQPSLCCSLNAAFAVSTQGPRNQRERALSLASGQLIMALAYAETERALHCMSVQHKKRIYPKEEAQSTEQSSDLCRVGSCHQKALFFVHDDSSHSTDLLLLATSLTTVTLVCHPSLGPTSKSTCKYVCLWLSSALFAPMMRIFLHS